MMELGLIRNFARFRDSSAAFGFRAALNLTRNELGGWFRDNRGESPSLHDPSQTSLPNGKQLRVLYALWHYPHVAETYVTTEINYMRRCGVHVEAWSEVEPIAPFETDVPIHRGTLEEVIKKTKPHLVHSHWLGCGKAYRTRVAKAGLPMTVRGHHPKDILPAQIGPLQMAPNVRRVYLFPQFVAQLGPNFDKIRPAAACFDPDLYHAQDPKDPRLVVRLAPCRQVKDLQFFMRVAARCPNHRFVLAACRTIGSEGHEVELADYNRSLGSPVEFHVDLSNEKAAALCREAGTYFYTVGPKETYAMPISVSEAMGAGCYVLSRNLPGALYHIGESGRVYADEEEAVRMIRETETWSQETWRRIRERSVRRGNQHFASPKVLQPILQDWLAIAAEGHGINATSKAIQSRAA